MERQTLPFCGALTKLADHAPPLVRNELVLLLDSAGLTPDRLEGRTQQRHACPMIRSGHPPELASSIARERRWGKTR